LGIEADGRFDRALARLEASIHGPGSLRAFIHQDAGPHNFVLTPEGATPLDYEFAGFGQCLIDIACVRLAFPPAFRGRVLAPEVVEAVEARFRSAAVETIPKLGDDSLYHEALAQACAHWALSKLIGFWRNYLRDRLESGESWDTREGRQPERAAFFRRMVFTYLRLTLNTLEETDHLDAIRETLDRILTSLLKKWPETPLLGAYPAFGGEPWQYP
jgi:Ser/Thr protein kinase RdoA (MazF antagonist)